MSGNLAVLALPDDHRLHVQLTRYFYASTLAKLRRDIEGNRTGLAVVEVAAPINAPTIQVAMNRHDAYIRGFRVAAGPQWWAFQEPGKPLPSLPGAPVKPLGLDGGYAELGLPPSINMRPEELLTKLAGFNGRPDPRFCQGIVLLLFLLAEALRFDSVLMECARYFSVDAYTIHPERFKPVVNNWKSAVPNDRNVLLGHLPKP